jgi:hypothetical protein
MFAALRQALEAFGLWIVLMRQVLVDFVPEFSRDTLFNQRLTAL